MLKKLVKGIIYLTGFIILIVLLKTVDVRTIEENGEAIGLSVINNIIPGLYVYRPFWYELSNIIGIIAICICVAFAFAGVWQFAQRKSLCRVDLPIIGLGFLYIITIGIYVFFNKKLVINVRPILLSSEEIFEASFPSSHALLSVVVFGSTLALVKRFIKVRSKEKIYKIIILSLCAALVLSRLLSGAHWITDVFGGILLGLALVNFYEAYLIKICKKRRNQ